MKHPGWPLLLILLMICIFAGPARADMGKKIKTGNIFLGSLAALNLQLGNQTTQSDDADGSAISNIGFDLDLHGGYFFIDGLEFGPAFGVNYDRYTVKNGGVDSEDLYATTISYDLGVQLGYFWDNKSTAVPFIQLEVGYRRYQESADNGDSVFSTVQNGFLIGPAVGVNIFFTRAIALELGANLDYSMGFRTDETDQENQSEIDSVVHSFQYGIGIGFNVFF